MGNEWMNAIYQECYSPSEGLAARADYPSYNPDAIGTTVTLGAISVPAENVTESLTLRDRRPRRRLVLSRFRPEFD